MHEQSTPLHPTSIRPLRRSVRRTAGTLGAIAAIGVASVVGIADPAGATVTVTTSGTTMTVNLTGTEEVAVSCIGGKVSVDGQTGTPSINCATFTKLTITGDGAGQRFDGTGLEAAAFAAKPYLVAILGDGADLVYETTRADQIDLGPGTDNVYLPFEDTADDEINASSSNATVTINHEVANVLRTMIVSNGERLEVASRAGDDIIDVSGITTASTIDDVGLYGSEGDDVVRGAQFASDIFAGAGNNQIFGGPAADNIGSEGNGDVIQGGGGADRINDRTSPRSGRTISNQSSSGWYFAELAAGDATSRIRPGANGTATVTNSLSRPGQQALPSQFTNVVTWLGFGNADGTVDGRGLVDVVALDSGRKVFVDGDSFDNDLLDITIPTGSWTTQGTAQQGFVTPANASYGQIKVDDFGEMRVHGPWTNKNAGFVHRVSRDLRLKFEAPATISSVALALGDGSTTRAAVIGNYMNTDEYRGLDVDRTFQKYLTRNADPSGRAYWINAIRNGRALWRFRAQLFGSNEYFNKAGATNAAYLDEVYQDVLGRLPDPSGRAYWIGKLNAGADRGSVALQFINAQEFRRFLIDEQFLRFLDRKPTTNEQTTWINTLKTSATGEQQLIAYLAGTQAYFDRS